MALLAALLLLAAPAARADITVTEPSDTPADGLCSYNEAIAAAIAPATPSSECPGAAAGGTTTIRVPAGSYSVTTSTIPAGADVAIAGASADASQTKIASSSGRLLDIQAGASVALRDLTIHDSTASSGPAGSAGGAGPNGGVDAAGAPGGTGGPGLPGGDGGAARNAGTLTVTNVVFDEDRAGDGGPGGPGGSGGIGGIRVSGSSPSGGNGGTGGTGGAAGGGGAIANSGTLTISDSIISNDFAGHAGAGGVGGAGGIGGNPNGQTFLGGQGGTGGPGGTAGGAGGNGGAILNSGTATITNTAFSGDGAGQGGQPGQGGQGGSGFSVPNPNTDHSTFAGPGGRGGDGGTGGSSAGGYGGAVFTTGTLHLTGVSIFDATAGQGGSGAFGGDGGPGGAGFGAKGGTGGPGAAGTTGATGGRGGGIYAAGGTVTIDATTIDQSGSGRGGFGGSGGDGGPGYDASVSTGAGGNGAAGGAGGNGGELAMAGAVVTITNSTLSQGFVGDGGGGGRGGTSSGSNSLAATGGNGGNAGNGGTSGGIFAALGGSSRIDVNSTTIVSNVAGRAGIAGGGGGGNPAGSAGSAGIAAIYGGIADTGAGGTSVIRLTNTIVASNTPSNCLTVSDGGHNLRFGDTTCPGTTGDPKLSGLSDNGGPAPTDGLEPGSAALDAGAGCPAVDERGVTRPQGAACDIGAFERGAAPVCHDFTVHVPYDTDTNIDAACSEATGAPVRIDVDSPPHGTAFGWPEAAADVIRFSAPPDFSGTETLTFHGATGDGVSAVQTLTIVVDPPVAPTVTGTAPTSPAGERSTHVTGSGAPAAATVSLFTTDDCSGTPVATGTPAEFASPGLAVTVDHDTTTTFHAAYVDSGVTSACSTTSATYVEDETAPDTVIDGRPADPTTEEKPSFTFHASEPAAAFTCSLDQGTPAFAPCPAAGFTPALPLAPGTYTFRVRATDLVGLTDGSPATLTFTVAPSPSGGGGGAGGGPGAKRPNTILVKHPRSRLTVKTRKAKARISFKFRSSPKGATFTCKLDKHKAKPCRSPARYRVGRGKHVFTVTAKTKAGADRTPARFRFRVIVRKRHH